MPVASNCYGNRLERRARLLDRGPKITDRLVVGPWPQGAAPPRQGGTNALALD